MDSTVRPQLANVDKAIERLAERALVKHSKPEVISLTSSP